MRVPMRRLGFDRGGGACGRGCRRRCRRRRVAGGPGTGGRSEGGETKGMRFSLVGSPPTARHGHRGRHGRDPFACACNVNALCEMREWWLI